MQAGQAVAHLALDLGARRQGRNGVDDDEFECARADQGVRDLQSLLAVVGLTDEQRVGVDAQGAGVGGIEGVLGVDEGADAPLGLSAGYRVQLDSGP